MDILILIGAMILVGLVIGALAGVIWRGERPLGTTADYAIAVAATVLIGLGDWFVIPAFGLGELWKYLGVATEPALGALLILWLIRRSRR